ncbi:DUF3995 domain-containing protein [Algibacter sp. R77976]|uniref:DUF3995 domain-containing protein n=1 Tax=Algibacter sp. R77976 TaxID=3093873 RepID=UPI0037CA19AB
MMTTILSIFLLTIFTGLGLIHFYWLFGGKWGLEKVIPTKENQTSRLLIPKFATLIVALVLLLFALIYLVKSGLINVQIPNLVTKYGYWIIPSIFILRAIGDFKYVGFFKKLKNTEFAKTDSKWFAPLCLTIGIFGILIQLMNK